MFVHFSAAYSTTFAGWSSYLPSAQLTIHLLENKAFITNLSHFFPSFKKHSFTEKGMVSFSRFCCWNTSMLVLPHIQPLYPWLLRQNISEVFLLVPIYLHARRLHFFLTSSTHSNINKLRIYMGFFPNTKLIRNLGNIGDLEINLSTELLT